MDYSKKLQYHYRPKKGWVNDPNGLVYFDGYYHVFYQHAPEYEIPWQQPMHWGHARTKDFLHWEELPVALFPDATYDNDGCFSGTAIVKDGVLYLFYASIYRETRETPNEQTVSVAYSTDGIHFEKYAGNPVIDHYPADGGRDFRDPAVCRVGDAYYCVMASGHPESREGRLLSYRSRDLFHWEYVGIMRAWSECRFTECPSLVPVDGKYLLTASVCPFTENHYFHAMYGSFKDGEFEILNEAEIDKGPDQYAGQVFHDHLGRNLLITWMPGWNYKGYYKRDIGCFTVPREIKVEGGKITAYPIEELQYLLKDEDPCLERTENGFRVERTNREPLVYEGEITDLKILRDEYVAEIFVNGGEEVYTVLL